jgi:glycosyltransferase involved in cell wall biosynthesis
MNLIPAFDPEVVRVFPYFLRASDEVRRVFDDSPVEVTNLNKGKYDPTTVTTLWRVCKEHAIDVMHLFCYASSTFGRLVSRVTGIPAIIHDFDTQIYFPYPAYLNIMDRVLASKTAMALAASPMCRDYMRDTRRVPGDRIEILPHAIPAARFEVADRISRSSARAELGWDEDQTVFCTVTKLGPDRGNEFLLRAFARVASARPEVKLALAYKPTYYHRVPEEYEDLEGLYDTDGMRRELDDLASELGIADRVDFAESLDDPDLYFAACDALVMPFLHERFSSVHLLEGFAHARPAIATDLGEQAELMTDGDQGILVPPGDEEALAQAMIRLANDESERKAMGRSARELAERLSVDASADRLAELYRAVAGAREQARSPALT